MKAIIKGKEIEIFGDISKCNRELKKYNFKDISSLEVEDFNQKVKVDLKYQKIHINNKQINIDLDKRLENIKWVHFKRHTVSYRMVGGKETSHQTGIGFQGQYKDNNIQRIILLNKGGYTINKKK